MENKICSRCIIDTHTYPDIVFDEKGVCNVCHTYDQMAEKFLIEQEELGENYLNRKIARIKEEGKNKEYDCILGISGGVDSSYLAIRLKEWGLRPLALHIDNGWNTELAVSNIEKLIKQLGLDLFTYVVNWEELRDLELSYMAASVVDIDIPNEMCSQAIINRKAAQLGIKYIITGHNYSSEGWLPPTFSHYKYDTLNLNDIHRKFGKVKLKTYPKIGYFRTLYYSKIKKIDFFSPLNYMHYDKEDAKKVLIDQYNWRDYGGKHFENSYTRFYQSYILPEKFKLDKRRSHLSSLICAGQLTRKEALKVIETPHYTNEELLASDRDYFIKKLRITEKEFENYIHTPPKKHTDYRSYINVQVFVKKHFSFLKKFIPSP
jgi:N-acetyl sugar amidotransferase